jgi:hypothetical protein
MPNIQCEAIIGTNGKPHQGPRVQCSSRSRMLVNVYDQHNISKEVKCCMRHLRHVCAQAISDEKTLEVFSKVKAGTLEYYEPYALDNIKNLPPGGRHVQPLPVVHAPLPVVHAPLPVVHAPLPVVHAPLPVVHAPLPVVHAPPAPLVLPVVLDDGKHPCCICYDDTNDVFCTSHRHALCQECFENHVLAETKYIDFNGTVKCPLHRMHECDCEGYTVGFIAKHVPDKVFTEYDRKRYEVKEKDLITKIEDDFKKKLALEQSMTELQKDRQHVVDNILTLRCPKCSQAYHDFDGCLSLTCTKCKCNFCAKCHHQSVDSKANHDHIATCAVGGKLKNGWFFATKNEIFKFQNNMRTQKLQLFLKGRSNKFDLLEALYKDLIDLKLKPREFR